MTLEIWSTAYSIPIAFTMPRYSFAKMSMRMTSSMSLKAIASMYDVSTFIIKSIRFLSKRWMKSLVNLTRS